MKALWKRARRDSHDWVTLRRLAVMAILATFAATSFPLIGWTEDDEFIEDSRYQYFGMPCSRLVELSRDEVKALIHHKNREHFRNFCLPEDLLNCSDYNVYLYDLGSLKRQDGANCQFIPAKRQ